MWSLELASEFFHDFFAYYFGQEVKNSDQISVQNSRRNTVAVGPEFDIPKVKFGHVERALWSERIRDRNVD